jgi:hypothetical protein
MIFFKKVKPSLDEQIEQLSSDVYRAYASHLVQFEVKQKLKQYLGLREYDIQKQEIHSLKSIYILLCTSAMPVAKHKEETKKIIDQFLSHTKCYSLSQIYTLLKTLQTITPLTPTYFKLIDDTLQKMQSSEGVHELTLLLSVLSKFRSRKYRDKADRALTSLLSVESDKLAVLYKIMCETPKGVSPMTDLTRLTRRLAYHLPDLCHMNKPLLVGFYSILTLMLKAGIFVEDEFNGKWLSKMMYRFTKSVIYITGDPEVLHSNRIPIHEFQSLFHHLYEKSLISLENLYFIFQLECFTWHKHAQMNPYPIKDFIQAVKAIYYQDRLTQATLTQLIDKWNQKNMDNLSSHRLKRKACRGMENREEMTDSSDQVNNTLLLTPCSPPPPYSKVDPYPIADMQTKRTLSN